MKANSRSTRPPPRLRARHVFWLALCPLAAVMSSARAQDMQAMEAAMREAQALGVGGADFEAMQSLMQQMQDAGFDDPSVTGAAADAFVADAAPRQNHFDIVGRRADTDCESYSDVQAFSFCQAAAQAYLVYLELLQSEGPTQETDLVYEAHVENAVNFLHYRDTFLGD